MKPATTILEISKILKISPSTVSRALKNHPDIAPHTKEKVLELARKLDYEPNLYAVGLRTSNSKEIAVIVPNLTGFFYDAFIAAVEEEARRQGYSLIILLSGDDPKIEQDNLRICKQRRVDAVFVCVTPHTTEALPFTRLSALDIPVIFFDKVPPFDKTNRVCVADEHAALLAAQALLDHDKKNILSLFGDPNMSITSRRLKAYTDAFHTVGESHRVNVKHAVSSEAARKMVALVFSSTQIPDAIFCMSDEILIGAMKALQVLSVRIPEEVSVIAISNGFFPKLYYPEITYVETSAYKLGKLVFQRMMDYVAGQKSPVEVRAEAVLHVGGSLK